MNITSKFSMKLANIFSNDKKSHVNSQASAASADLEAAQEKARKEQLVLTKTSRLGFPYRPTCMSYDPVQHLLAIGTKHGYVKLYGGEMVEYTLFHSAAPQGFTPIPSSYVAPNNNNNNTSNSSSNNNSNNSNNSPNPNSSHYSQSSAASSNSAAAYAASSGGSERLSTSALYFPSAVLFMTFVINEGALITYCDDNILSFWNLRQKQPGILFSKKLMSETVTAMHLQYQSNWLYIGTEKGNTYLLNVYNNFAQSGYDIKWNNVIELSQKNKPGKVVHLSDFPNDSSKLLIGFDSGLIVLWNLKLKRSESRFYGTTEIMSSVSWLTEGKQFVSSHNNGSLIIWNSKGDCKPVKILHPHMKDTNAVSKYNMVKKVAWENNSNGDSLMIFADGLPSMECNMRDAITIIRNNKFKTVVEMKERVIDFIIVSNRPFSVDSSDPTAIIVLLEASLVVLDLKTDGFPTFRHHHSYLQESAVSVCHYAVDPPRALFNALQHSKEQRQSKQQASSSAASSSSPSSSSTSSFLTNASNTTNTQTPSNQQFISQATISKSFYSSLTYPINGGLRGTKSNSLHYNEVIVTGHDDGSVKIWDSSGLDMSLMCKLKTQTLVDKKKTPSSSSDPSNDAAADSQPPSSSSSAAAAAAFFKISALCMIDDYLAVAGASGHVILYKYANKNNTSADDEMTDMPLLEVHLNETSSPTSAASATASTTNESASASAASANDAAASKRELKCLLRAKIGFRQQGGFQPELVCLLFWSHRPPVVSHVKLMPKNNIMLFSTDETVVCVDSQARTVLMNVTVGELNAIPAPSDHSSRTQRLFKRNNKNNVSCENDDVTPNDVSPKFLVKQSTMDVSNHRDLVSRSSSSSSLENNASTGEIITCLAINDSAAQNKDSQQQQQTNQLWVGTSNGSVFVMNLHSSTSGGNTSPGAGAGGDNQVPQPSLAKPSCSIVAPSGQSYTLAGPIVDIAFLDMNGNLLTHASNSEQPVSGKKRTGSQQRHSHTSTGGGGGGGDGAEIGAGDVDFDSTDFLYLSQSSMSNSIAENFYGPASSSTGASSLSNSVGYPPSTAASHNVSPPPAPLPPPPVEESNRFSTFSKTSKKILSATRFTKGDSTSNASDNNMDSSSPTSSSSMASSPAIKQYVILTSETQIRTLAMPSQTCIHKHTVADGVIAKASVVVINALSYLTCYTANGNLLVYNLPNPTLKSVSLLNSPHFVIREKEDRASKTFTFGARGHSLFMSSPTEIQKVFLSTTTDSNGLSETLSEFFDPKIASPPPPKPNLFKTIFAPTATFDREELFGENSGKPSVSIVKNVEGDVQKTKKELTELQKLALERGEKLNALQLKTEEMTMAASSFAKNAHDLANKYKSKRFGF